MSCQNYQKLNWNCGIILQVTAGGGVQFFQPWPRGGSTFFVPVAREGYIFS